MHAWREGESWDCTNHFYLASETLKWVWGVCEGGRGGGKEGGREGACMGIVVSEWVSEVFLRMWSIERENE